MPEAIVSIAIMISLILRHPCRIRIQSAWIEFPLKWTDKNQSISWSGGGRLLGPPDLPRLSSRPASGRLWTSRHPPPWRHRCRGVVFAPPRRTRCHGDVRLVQRHGVVTLVLHAVPLGAVAGVAAHAGTPCGPALCCSCLHLGLFFRALLASFVRARGEGLRR